MRLNQTQSIGELVQNVQNPNFETNTLRQKIEPKPFLTKRQLWDLFLIEFKLMYGMNFIDTEQNTNNIKALFYYFLGDVAFLTCDNVRSDLSEPSFRKGVMLVGGYGIGKTAYFKVFERIFNKFKLLRFKGFGAKELVSSYEACTTPFDKTYMIDNIVRPRLFIDDINSERIASNYGNCDVIEEILFKQNEKGNKTFVTCNHTNSENNTEKTLKELGVRYGGRLHDRFFEMFNIIEFTGKSQRR